jgi:lipopolysaccharide transport system ATP-binding protein
MGEVSKEGRTVFFVSHDLNAILSTCSRALLIDHGTLVEDGAVDDVASTYQSGTHGAVPADGLFVRQRPHPRFSVPVFLSAQVQPSSGDRGDPAAYGDPFRLVIETNPDARVRNFGVDVRILDRRQRPISYLSSVEMRGRYFSAGDVIDCIIPALPFVPGTYTIDLMAHVPGIEPLDHWGGEITFEIVRFDPYGEGSTFHPTDETGSVVPPHEWQTH